MKTRIVVAILFLLGLGTSGYYNHKAAAATTNVAAIHNQATTQCCGPDPDGTLWPPTHQ